MRLSSGVYAHIFLGNLKLIIHHHSDTQVMGSDVQEIIAFFYVDTLMDKTGSASAGL